MKRKVMVVLILCILVAALLTACGPPTPWSIAGEGDACTLATVIERDWSSSDHNDFYLLLEAEDGEIGYAIVTAYQYNALQLGAETCVTR
jgi:hypothetical protein